MKRLSRSDSSMIVARQIGLLGIAEFGADVAQRAGGAEHGGERRLEIVGDRGEQRRAQSLGLGDALDPVHLLDQPHALDRERALIQQRVQEPPLIGREHRARLVAVDAHHADGAAPGMHRQEQAFGAGQRIGAAAGGAVVLPRPFRRGEIGIVENIFRRVAGLHRDRAVLGQAAARPALSASARSDRPSPTARRRAFRRRQACG